MSYVKEYTIHQPVLENDEDILNKTKIVNQISICVNHIIFTNNFRKNNYDLSIVINVHTLTQMICDNILKVITNNFNFEIVV